MRPDGCPNWEWHLSEETKIEGGIYKISLIKMMNIEDVELNLYLSSDVIIKPPLSVSTVSITLAFICFNGFSIYLINYIRILQSSFSSTI